MALSDYWEQASNPGLSRLQGTAEELEQLAKATADGELQLHKGFNPLVDELLNTQLQEVAEIGQEPATKWEVLALQSQVRLGLLAQSHKVQRQIQTAIAFGLGVAVGAIGMLLIVSLLNLRVSSGYDEPVVRRSHSIDAPQKVPGP